MDTPLYERELADERTTARVTVDVAEDGVFGMFALEPSTGALRQMVLALDGPTCTALIDMLADARSVIETMQRTEAA